MSQRDQVRGALCRDLEAAQYTADRAFRQYDASDPENRLATAELETRWNRALQRIQEIEHKLAQHDTASPDGTPLPAEDLVVLGANLERVPLFRRRPNIPGDQVDKVWYSANCAILPSVRAWVMSAVIVFRWRSIVPEESPEKYSAVMIDTIDADDA